ncbi:MAG TPA: YfiR family protein [Solimonas sp.]|nr:YfiR family protein [Solimonas sp.]
MRRRAAVARRQASALLLALCCVGAGLLPSLAMAGDDLELKVKAAFLFNFVKFVSWPPERRPADGQPYQLCMIDAAAFASVLTEAVRDKQISGHPLQVRSLHPGDALDGCHVAYVASDDPITAEARLRAGAGLGVLTVHEARSAINSGVVRFFQEDRRVRFEVNTAAADQQHLQLSSRLLGVATRL